MSFEGRRPVLLVDDDPDWRDAIAEHLEAAGLAVVVATDGSDAWQCFQQSEPLAVITDVQMPFMDGRQLLANVRARNFRVPVIVVTGADAQARESDLMRAYVVIAKPADPDHIIATVKAAIGHRTSHTPLAKMWMAAASLPRAVEQRPALLSRAWWATRRQQAGVIQLIVATLLVLVALAARRRRGGHRRGRWLSA